MTKAYEMVFKLQPKEVINSTYDNQGTTIDGIKYNANQMIPDELYSSIFAELKEVIYKINESDKPSKSLKNRYYGVVLRAYKLITHCRYYYHCIKCLYTDKGIGSAELYAFACTRYAQFTETGQKFVRSNEDMELSFLGENFVAVELTK